MPYHVLSGLPFLAGAAVYIGIIVFVAAGGALLFHRFVPHNVLVEHNEIAGFIFAVVGVVYAVLLAFVAIAVWEHFTAAEQRTYEEASRLTAVYRKCDLFPQMHVVRAEMSAYVRRVIEREWPQMQRGENDPQAEAMAEHIAFQVRHLRVATPAQQNVHAAMVQSIDEALVDRDYRTSEASIGVSSFLWFILYLGAAATILFAYFFAYKHRWVLVSMVGMLAFMLGLVLFLIAAVDYPFRGQIRVEPEAFLNALHHFQRVGP